MLTVPVRLSLPARAAIMLFAAVLLGGCGQESPEKLLSSAKEYLAKGDRNAAVIQLKNLVAKAPNDGEARLLLGQALLDGGEYAAAEQQLSKALELRQPQDKVLPSYARVLLAQGKRKEMMSEIARYKLSSPDATAEVRTLQGDAQVQLGNAARAREAYAAALAAVPGFARARLGEAVLLANEGKPDDALKAVDEAIAADTKLAEARQFRADVLFAMGDRDGARKALEDAVAANSRHVPSRLALIGVLIDAGDFDGAAKLIDSTLKVAPGDLRVTYMDALLSFRQGNMAKARQQSEQLLKQAPEHVQTLVLAGMIDLQEKQFTAAEAHLRQAVAKAPNHVGARQLLVQTYLRSGQPAKAKDTLQPLVDRGLSGNTRLQLLAGETYLANGDVQRATAFFQEATKGESTQRMAARTRLGQIALAAGKSEEGFRELEAASQVDAGANQADLVRIAGHLRRKEFDKAMAAVAALEQKQPKNPLTFQMYGVVNVAKGNLEAARKSFEKALELQPNYVPAAYNLAMLDLAQNKADDARKRYEAMIAREPNNDQLYLALAELQARTGASPRDVAATLQRAAQADPQSPGARVALIGYYLRSGDTKAALAAAQAALTAIPSDPRVLAAAATAQEAAGEVNQAVGTYTKLASLQPQSPMPLYRLAALRFRQNDTEGAIETLRQVQKIAPEEGRNVAAQAIQIYVAAGRYDDAFKEARELQKSAPDFAGGWALEGDISVSQRKFADAERLYREALKREPKANAVAVKLHGVLSAAGKAGEADAWAKKWIAENPRDTAMRTYLGDRQLGAKNLKAAAAQYQAVLATDPNDVHALNNLAWIGAEQGDPKALGYSERAAKIEPNSFAVLDTYGVLLLKNGQVDKALPILQRAHQLAPARNDVRLNYAKALIKAGKKDDARKELEALAKVSENFNGKNEVAELLKEL
jgi:putative PEP-CTERM system TPR-repeat lipoprotein